MELICGLFFLGLFGLPLLAAWVDYRRNKAYAVRVKQVEAQWEREEAEYRADPQAFMLKHGGE
jgi:hypothetical protein